MRVVVTGGSSGVGAALVARLVKAGHEVHNLDVVAPKNDGSTYMECDMSSETSIDAAVAQLPDTLDALVNVAGIAKAAVGTKVVAVNFLGLRHLTRSLFDRLIEHGSVVSVSSIAGRDWARRYDKLLPLLESANMAEGLDWCDQNLEWVERDPYGLSKQLATAFTLREAQTFLAAYKQINCVSPGNIDTPLYEQFEAMMGEDHSNWMIDQAGRFSTADEIAEVIDMLISSGCIRLNGVDIPVDGGYSAGIESGWIDFSASPMGQALAAARAN